MKNIFALTLCALALTSVQAQQIYLKLNAGVGIGTATTALRTEATVNDQNVTTTKVGSGSLGSGGQFGFAAGYVLSDHINVEVNGQYLLGFTQKTTYTSPTTTQASNTFTRQWRVIPQVIFNIGDSEFQPYTRFGLIVPVGGKTVTEQSSSSTIAGTTTTIDQTMVTRGALALGWTSGIGLRKNLGDRSFVFADLGFQSLSIGAKKGELTVYKVNGRDVLVDLNTREKEVEYVREYVSGSNSEPGSPSKTLRSWSPFSNLALNVGLQINL